MARLYESLARSYTHDDDKGQAETMKYNFFKQYPQLIPFSGFKIKMNLSTRGLNNAQEKNIIKELKGCDIDFTSDAGINIPTAYINFRAIKNKFEIDYQVTDVTGKPVVPLQKMYFKKEDGVGKELALRLFGIGGPVEFN